MSDSVKLEKKCIVVLTGAGISAESGIRTFRDQNGLWENHRIEDVASPEGFERDPELVHNFYNLRRRQLRQTDISPNAAHLALAELERNWPGQFLLVTQNVDNLHERAGSIKLLHMHGELLKVRCLSCEKSFEWVTDLGQDDRCPQCQTAESLRPDIVWFGEMPYHMDDIYSILKSCDLFVSVGTSGLVYPAAGFVQMATRAQKIEVNIRDSEISASFTEHLIGPAATEVPRLVSRLLAN